jgi:hypothetical protein
MSNNYFSWNSLRLAICAFICLVSSLEALPTAAQVSFLPPINYRSGGSGPLQAAVGDINKDGKPDIVVVNNVVSTIGVLFGSGTGVFSTATTYSTGLNTKPFSVVLGDINSDGLLDAVTTNEARTTSVLLGTNTGGFTAARQYSIGNNDQIENTVLGDVNQDGSLDLIGVNFGANAIGVLLNNKQGAFPSAPISYPVGADTRPQGIAVGDFNGDNSLDVAVSVLSTPTTNEGVAILLNNGAGAFLPPVIYSVGGTLVDPKYVLCGDLNGDGKLDIVTGNVNRGTVSVLLNQGNGSFAPAISYNGRVGADDLISIALGDMDGDGKQDIVSVNYTRNLLRILLNDGKGVFRLLPNTYATPSVAQGPYAGGLADLNADGKLDVVTANYDSNDLTIFLNATSTPLAGNTAFDLVTPAPYPNPAHGSVMIDLPTVAGLTQGSMKLCDALGRVVVSETIPLGKSHKINLTGVNSGIYLLSIRLGESIAVRRLAVE